MFFETLLFVVGGVFMFVLACVSWLKFREHLHAHRNEHEQHSHHVAAVRKIRRRKKSEKSQEAIV